MSNGTAPLICEAGGGGLILPLFGDAEHAWPRNLRVALYLAGLLWAFAGVAIVADIFMAAIEQITSKTKPLTTVGKDGTSKTYHLHVWNPTVANLTLMALGSSAPEILLSVIEVVSNGFYSGDLGPSTIVGSAAFNLMVILAVCVLAIPAGESRTIAQFGVFAITAAFSVLAYLWLAVILMVWTPDVVTPTEGIITFALFPVLVVLAYLADVGFFSRKGAARAGARGYVIGVDGGALPEAEMSKIVAEVKAKYPADQLSKEVLAELVSHYAAQRAPKSRAYYRIQATRQAVGGKRVLQPAGHRLDEELAQGALVKRAGPAGGAGAADDDSKVVLTFSFNGRYSVSESDKRARVTVLRAGNRDVAIAVRLKTADGTAKAGSDYKAVDETVTIPKAEISHTLEVPIIDDDEVEADEHFFVKIVSAKVVQSSIPRGTKAPKVHIKLSQAQVTVYDDDEGGVLAFEQDHVRAKDTEEAVVLRVVRREGNKGRISVDYKTADGTAVRGYDYTATAGTLRFEDKELVKEIRVPLVQTNEYDDKEEHFAVHLSNPTGGASLEKGLHGRTQGRLTATVTIVNDKDLRKDVDSIYGLLPQINTDKLSLGKEHWLDQFAEAITFHGPDDMSPPTVADYLGHFATLPWKLLFALCPPTLLCDGVACFTVALILIGLVTAIIGDLAGLLGCVLGLPDAITAITLVALGTSLPDTFASMASAKGEPNADASIGNVTGSNSVNVFLGLGLPWTIGALYWAAHGRDAAWDAKYSHFAAAYPGGAFVVPAGDLGYSVTVFTACAAVTLGVMGLRRWVLSAELGGPAWARYPTAVLFVMLWLLYIVLSARNSLATAHAK